MKTPRFLLLAAVTGGILAASIYAVPPTKKLPLPPGSAASPSNATEKQKPMRMVVTSPGTKLKTTVVCTPELASTDPRCRAHCGK